MKKISNNDEITLKCDSRDGSILNGIKEPILFSFVFDECPGFKAFCESEPLGYKKVNKSVLKKNFNYKSVRAT